MWSALFSLFPFHLLPLLCSNSGESVRFPCASVHASSALYFSSFTYSCWKKLAKHFCILSGFPQHPLCTTRAKIHHSELFKKIKIHFGLSQLTYRHQPILDCIKGQESLETKFYWHKIPRSNRLQWVLQRKSHLFSMIKFKYKYVLLTIKTLLNTTFDIHVTANVSRTGITAF